MLVEDVKVVARGLPWREPTDDEIVALAVNEAHAAGSRAAGSEEQNDHIHGTVRLGLRSENYEIVQRLLQMGWSETDNGVEWIVALPDGHRLSRDYLACKAYADAFRRRMRELLPEAGYWEVLSQSSSY